MLNFLCVKWCFKLTFQMSILFHIIQFKISFKMCKKFNLSLDKRNMSIIFEIWEKNVQKKLREKRISIWYINLGIPYIFNPSQL